MNPVFINQPTEHARLGGSNYDIWGHCPGAPEMWDKVPKQKTTIYMAEGTLAHKICEFRLKRLKTGSSELFRYEIGSLHEVDGFNITVTEEMLDAVDVYVDYVVGRMAEYKVGWQNVYIEHKVEIPGPWTEKLFGTLDVMIYVPFNRLILIDFKYGAGVKVDVIGNFQLSYYDIGAVRGLPKEDREDLGFIENVVVQPRGFGHAIQSHVFPFDNLIKEYADLSERVIAVKPGAPLSAGDHCKRCPAKASCPALAEKSNEVAGVVFKDIKPKDLSNLSELSLQEKVRVADHYNMIIGWLDSIMDDLKDMAERGIEIPNWKLVPTVTKRAYKKGIEKALVLAAQTASDRWSEEQVEKAVLRTQPITIGDLEKLIKKEKWDLDLAEFTEKGKPGRTLAKITDIRQEQTPAAIAAFKHLDI